MQPVPILFIHGFNGAVENWVLSGFRQALISWGADPDLLRVFHYGWREGGAEPRVYNNQGDIRAIAARLSYREGGDEEMGRSQVRRLSEASVAAGGPARVTIVAHSMGGLVARYYLSRRVPDEWGTVNEGVVERLIAIGTPHLGTDIGRITQLVPRNAAIWKVLRALDRLPFIAGRPSEELAQLDAEVRRWQGSVQLEELPIVAQGLLDSPALAQMVPGSPFLQALNAPGAFPRDVQAALIWGDVQFTGAVRWGRVPLWARTLSLGDLLIEADSASTLPNAEALRFPRLWQREVIVQIGDPNASTRGLEQFLPPVAHTPLLHQRTTHEIVARLVGLGVGGG